jgi:hypothetical protein
VIQNETKETARYRNTWQGPVIALQCSQHEGEDGAPTLTAAVIETKQKVITDKNMATNASFLPEQGTSHMTLSKEPASQHGPSQTSSPPAEPNFIP